MLLYLCFCLWYCTKSKESVRHNGWDRSHENLAHGCCKESSKDVLLNVSRKYSCQTHSKLFSQKFYWQPLFCFVEKLNTESTFCSNILEWCFTQTIFSGVKWSQVAYKPSSIAVPTASEMILNPVMGRDPICVTP